MALPGVTNNSLPGIYAYVQFAQGALSAADVPYNALIIASKTAAGTAPTDQVIGPDTSGFSMQSVQDAISLAGPGSEAAIMVQDFMSINQSTPLYLVLIDGYGGSGSGASSTGTITVSGTATSAATLSVFVGHTSVSVGIATGDTASVIAANVAIAVNAQNMLPVTANAVSAVVTLTARQQGVRTNQISFQVQLQGNTNIGVTVSPTADSLMSGGTTSDDITNALAAIDATRFYYIISAPNDATNLGRLQAQVDTQALPTNGIRQRFFAGSQAASVATANAIAVGLNDPRGCFPWQMSSDWSPSELASVTAACVSLIESGFSNKTLNFDSFGAQANSVGLWPVKAPRSGLVPSKLQQESAIMNGVTPIAAGPSQSTYIVQLVTTYSLLNATYPDPRVRDFSIVSICDRYTDDLIALLSVLIGSSTVSADPVQNQAPPLGAVTPSNLASLINSHSRDYYNLGFLANIQDIISKTQVTYDQANAPNTLSAVIPLQPIPLLHIITLDVLQVL